MAIPNIVPRGNNDGETLGTQNKKWSNVHTVDVNLNGVSLTTKLAGIDSKNTTQDSNISTLEGNVSTLSSNKADKTSVYTKAEINNSLATKADATTTASALASKANAADVYTKTETDSALNSLSAQKVDKTRFDELAGTSEIVASGDGYVRWVNGLQVCWGVVNLGNIDIKTLWNSTTNLYYGAVSNYINFPVAFSSVPCCSYVSTNSNLWFVGTIGDETKVKPAYAVSPNPATQSIIIRYIAIGSWK